MDKIVDLLLDFYGPSAYFLIFGILLVCGLGVPMPEDVTLAAAGFSAYLGIINLWMIIVTSYVGILLGDSLVFLLGAVYGRSVTKYWPFRSFLTDDRLAAARDQFHKKGNKLIFAARFMPGLRMPIFFSAGTLHLPYRVFLFYDGLAALLSVPLIIGAVYYFGDEVNKVFRVIQRVEHGIIFVIAAVVLALGYKWYSSHKRLKRIES